MTLNEFIEQLKKTKPENRVEFFKQHPIDNVTADDIKELFNI